MMQQSKATIKKAEKIVNENNTDNVFKSINGTIMWNIKKSIEKGAGWIIDLVIDHNTIVSKYIPLASSTYIKLPKELDLPKTVFLLLFKILMIISALNGL